MPKPTSASITIPTPAPMPPAAPGESPEGGDCCGEDVGVALLVGQYVCSKVGAGTSTTSLVALSQFALFREFAPQQCHLPALEL